MTVRDRLTICPQFGPAGESGSGLEPVAMGFDQVDRAVGPRPKDQVP